MPGTRDAKYSIDTPTYRKEWDRIFAKKDKPKKTKVKKDARNKDTV